MDDNHTRKIGDESVRSLLSNIVIVSKCEMTNAQEGETGSQNTEAN